MWRRLDLCSSSLSACCCTPAQSYIRTLLNQMRQTRLSRLGMETSFKRDYEIVSYGGEVEVKNIVKRRDKRANLAWRWGGENFLTRNLVVSQEPRLAKKDVAVRSSLDLLF